MTDPVEKVRAAAQGEVPPQLGDVGPARPHGVPRRLPAARGGHGGLRRGPAKAAQAVALRWLRYRAGTVEKMPRRDAKVQQVPRGWCFKPPRRLRSSPASPIIGRATERLRALHDAFPRLQVIPANQAQVVDFAAKDWGFLFGALQAGRKTADVGLLQAVGSSRRRGPGWNATGRLSKRSRPRRACRRTRSPSSGKSRSRRPWRFSTRSSGRWSAGSRVRRRPDRTGIARPAPGNGDRREPRRTSAGSRASPAPSSSPGRGTTWSLGHIAWCERPRVLYWGDVDTHGFTILHELRESLRNAVQVLMDGHAARRQGHLGERDAADRSGAQPTGRAEQDLYPGIARRRPRPQRPARAGTGAVADCRGSAPGGRGPRSEGIMFTTCGDELRTWRQRRWVLALRSASAPWAGGASGRPGAVTANVCGSHPSPQWVWASAELLEACRGLLRYQVHEWRASRSTAR